MVKALVFGATIALVSCHRGLNSSPGAEGVGRASTEAFVISFVVILVIVLTLALSLKRKRTFSSMKPHQRLSRCWLRQKLAGPSVSTGVMRGRRHSSIF